MHVQTNGKVRRSSAEWRTIFDRFEASGVSMIAFCRREGLAKGTFSKWKHRLEESEGEEAAFIELTPRVSPSLRTLEAGEFELALPGGVRLRWKP